MPLPDSVPASVNAPMVSLPAIVMLAPLATVTSAVSSRRSAAASASVPALTCKLGDASVPLTDSVPPSMRVAPP